MKKQIKAIFTSIISMLLILSLAACDENSSSVGNYKTEAIIIGDNTDFSSFDTIGLNDGQGFYHYSRLVYETLIKFEDGKPVPSLAEAWESKDNSWILKLRKNVSFSDGKTFNSEAVKLNIEKLKELKPTEVSYYSGVAGITSIETPDEYTVVFNYENPYYPVLQDLSAIPIGMLSPSMFENGNNPYGNTHTDTAGTGMYLLKAENCSAGRSYTFTRNEKYWGAFSGPDSFTVKIIPEAESRLMAMQSGEIDLLYGSYQITYDMFSQLSDINGIKAVTSDSLYATRNLLLNTTSDILGDINVRKAIQHGINKQQIIDSILHGNEEKADYLFSRTLPFSNVEASVYEYDKQKAEALLNEAGWSEKKSDGIRIKDGKPLILTAIYMSERNTDEQILTAFKGQMADIGINVEVQGYETSIWYETGMSGNFDISVNDTYAFPQDPYVFLAAMTNYALDYPAQQGLSEKAEIDARITELLSTTHEKVIQDDFNYVLTVLQDEAVNVPVSYLKELCIYNSNKIKSVSFDNDGVFMDVSEIEMQ